MITIKSTGSFKNTEKFFNKIKKNNIFKRLSYYGELGVRALENATPVDTGVTAKSWSYQITQNESSISISWSNSSTTDSGIPIVILLYYGHATKNGGYVQGRDFINPTIKPIFDDILKNVWKEVTE